MDANRTQEDEAVRALLFEASRLLARRDVDREAALCALEDLRGELLVLLCSAGPDVHDEVCVVVGEIDGALTASRPALPAAA